MFHTLTKRFCVLNIVAILLSIAPARIQAANEAQARAAVVAPFIDEQTLAVARIDLSRVDFAALTAMLRRAAPDDSQLTKRLADGEEQLKQVAQALARLEVTELYVVVGLADIPQQPFFFVVPVRAETDKQQVGKLLQQVLPVEEIDMRPGAIVAASKATIDRLKKLETSPRPELARGFLRAGEGSAQIVVFPSDDVRRVIREMLPRLPDEVGGGSGKMLVDGLQWASASVQLPPDLAISIAIQSRDAEAAVALRGMILSGLQMLTRSEKMRQQWPEVDAFAHLMVPRVAGDQLLLHFADAQQAEEITRLLTTPLKAARMSANRRQTFDNLKHIGLAMHNHHDIHGRLPPQAIRGPDGKPLLSWRVAILPYLDAEALYKEFRLDEPWDSEHNRKLLTKIPTVLASPSMPDDLREKGMTTYLVPLTKSPAAIQFPRTPEAGAKTPEPRNQMVFDVPAGASLAKITDGTSNTIMVLEANAASAVPWTKPDDLEIDPRDPLKGLRDQGDGGFSTAFCDGSARFIRSSIAVETLLWLLQMNDGHVVADY